MILDGHAHLSPTDYGNVDLYLKALQGTGITQSIIVPGGMMDVRKMTDYIVGRAKVEKAEPNNDYVQQCCKQHENLLPFACLDPHLSTALKDLEKLRKKGFCGLKLSPLSHKFTFSSKALAAIVDWCGQVGWPVYSHVVYSPGAATSRYVTVAKNFPKTNFIVGHMGFGPADTEAVTAAIELPNFYLETSAANYLQIQEAVNKAGAEKVIFGSEFPLSHPVAELRKIEILPINDEQKELILGKNFLRLLPAKGR
ncbi:amidohydrolase family protein [Heliorestis acidaminivorans]|uniref:Amidohydrolase family protein n=1 Tax=Heliorestis acidaminivorans TaxID=553427 RepID=A0A6I0EUU3_9FIRM|nr:amidohydrolase family protein [Heliorestis acidaminivorans]KAB2951562.1 amidohydrolase family protein [Heliorestis acidaminivorans]